MTGDAAGRSHELFAVTQSFDPDHDDRFRWSARLSVALHLITAVILLFGPWWATERTPAMSARPFEVTFLHPSDDMASPVLDAAERDVDRVWARRQAPTAADDDESMGPSSTTVDIAGYVINLEKFLPGTEMFPFLTTELGLDPVPVTRSHGIEQWPFGIGARDAASSGMPPLLISDTDAQAIVDELVRVYGDLAEIKVALADAVGRKDWEQEEKLEQRYYRLKEDEQKFWEDLERTK